ncbi:MAG: creatininase family protein [Acidobacteria bacterium]|nr:creatininase family protein [Acidobacteriota bacterium]
MRRFVTAVFGLLLTVSLSHAQQQKKVSAGGYSIFDETVADMSFDEVEAAAKRNAIVLWPLGVIEEHGPHLPLGTDIYNSYLRMKQAARLLRERGIEVVIAPPMYWGINEATGSFGGSFTVRPSTLKAIIEDTFFSLRKDGFQAVYIIGGHGDTLHNRTILEAVWEARSTTGMRGFVLLDIPRMAQRLGVAPEQCAEEERRRQFPVCAHVLALPDPPAPPGAASGPPPRLDTHAGAGETSMVWSFFPELVNAQVIPKLEPTDYGVEDLMEWRKGWDNARQKTPLGYFGDPRSADPARGEQLLRGSTQRIADAIAQHVKNSAWVRQNP